MEHRSSGAPFAHIASAGLRWDKISTVADIASGVGAYAIPLLKQHSNIKYTLCDMPATITQAKTVSDFSPTIAWPLTARCIGVGERVSGSCKLG